MPQSFIVFLYLCGIKNKYYDYKFNKEVYMVDRHH